jgi:transposase
MYINPYSAELNPICHFLALLETHPILHVSRIRVKELGGRELDYSTQERKK